MDTIEQGMPREQVERILPPHQDLCMPLRRLGYQIIQYWVDEHWFVSVTYDYTGAQIDKEQRIRILDSPRNRVLRDVQIEWRPRNTSRPADNGISAP